MLTILRLLPFVAVVLIVCWLGRFVRTERLRKLQTFPDSWITVLAVGVAMTATIWFIWGSAAQPPLVHDEASYLLQAETFAQGRWAMPSPPLPEFFEQFHVLVVPAFASKYPPGHGLLLAPGIWLGLPGLVPLILDGIAAALLFMLVRRVTNGWVALLTLVLWLPMGSNLRFRPSYFSENTTSALWLAGWWALLEWRESGRERWLCVVAACTGWMAITRPLTAVAFALPIAGVVLWSVFKRKNWRVLMRPMLIGVAIVSLLPIWSVNTTGSWRETPYTLYPKTYFPFDVAGFGLDTTPGTRPLPPDMSTLFNAFAGAHVMHTVDHLPRILFDRWNQMIGEAFGRLRGGLVLFALASLWILPAAGWFAVGGSFLLTLCYLVYAHPIDWDLYYLEIIPLFPFLTACGIWGIWTVLTNQRSIPRREILRTTTVQTAVAGAILFTLLLIPLRAGVVAERRELAGLGWYHAAFADRVARLPGAKIIVFIRFSPEHNVHDGLVTNHANLADARAWLVHDRGAEDEALMALAPDRVPYLYDEATGTTQRLFAH